MSVAGVARQRSAIGLALQCAALAMPLVAWLRGGAPEVEAIAAVRIGLGGAVLAASLGLFFASVRALGPQWSLLARARDGHALVTRGPYGILRHPIYAATAFGLLGALIAVGDAATGFAALVLFAAGTPFRVRAEEDVLRAAFGTRCDAYARRVPAWGVRVPRRAAQPRAMGRADAGA